MNRFGVVAIHWWRYYYKRLVRFCSVDGWMGKKRPNICRRPWSRGHHHRKGFTGNCHLLFCILFLLIYFVVEWIKCIISSEAHYVNAGRLISKLVQHTQWACPFHCPWVARKGIILSRRVWKDERGLCFCSIASSSSSGYLNWYLLGHQLLSVVINEMLSRPWSRFIQLGTDGEAGNVQCGECWSVYKGHLFN